MSIKRIALFAAVAALLGAPAYAQVTLPIVSSVNSTDAIPDVPTGFPSASAVFVTPSLLRTFTLAQGGGHTGTPTLTTSGTGCGGTAATVKGTDVSGQITQGSSSGTSCVATFATPFLTAPECFVSINNVTDASLKCATSTTALTITSTSANSELINYLVVGLPGG